MDSLEEGVDKAIWVHVKVRSDRVEEEQRDPWKACIEEQKARVEERQMDHEKSPIEERQMEHRKARVEEQKTDPGKPHAGEPV